MILAILGEALESMTPPGISYNPFQECDLLKCPTIVRPAVAVAGAATWK
jgi:hypothetical protein